MRVKDAAGQGRKAALTGHEGSCPIRLWTRGWHDLSGSGRGGASPSPGWAEGGAEAVRAARPTWFAGTRARCTVSGRRI
jgi:hypothetical protein